MADVVVTLNAGSSSVKFAAFALRATDLNLLASGQVDGLGADVTFSVHTASGQSTKRAVGGTGGGHAGAVATIVGWLRDHGDLRVAAVGHRVVHGGVYFAEPVIIDDGVLAKLATLVPLAPLHQPHSISGIVAARRAFPGTLQVACFDTAFHRSHPFVADTFALPRRYYDAGVRRYGFHGLSYEFIARRLRALAPVLAAGRVLVAHLGNGASMCVLRGGRSVASTMGFTALDGLPMGTRCGQLDPGVVLYLMSQNGMDPQGISDLLYKESGLKGLSGISHDMRVLEADGSDAARHAIAYFVARIRHEIGGLSAATGGLDALVFTGGIGEHAWRIREAALSNMGWMGIDLDPSANRAGAQVISQASSGVTVFVLETDEERMIAEHTVEVAGLSTTADLRRASGGTEAPA